MDFGVGVVCFCVYFPEHLGVILHSYSSRREGLRADTQQTLAVMPVHVTQYYRAVPYLHHCSLGIPLVHSSMESRMEYKAEAFV